MKNKAFTLIELLAVIVILAIIALIATPLILNIIEKARKNAFLDSSYGIMDSARLYYIESVLDGTNGTAKVFSFDEGNTELTFGGDKPKGGIVAVSKEGKVSLALHNGTYCAQKTEDGSTIVLSKYEADKCTLDHIPDVTPDDSSKGQNVETVMTDEKAGENGTIRIDNHGNKRYAGSDPNNYVCFGIQGETCDEEHLYRIIGVFDQGTKIIKNNFYSESIMWDSTKPQGRNDWNLSSLNGELNGSSFYQNTNYIDEISQKYIVNATWNIGGISGSYTLEVFEENEEKKSLVGYIGLMSATDFGYGSNHTSCDRNTDLQSKNNACMSNNWLLSSIKEWTITLYGSSESSPYVFAITNYGYSNSSFMNPEIARSETFGARPSMYLKEEVKILSGEGTSSNPYILGV